MAEIMIEDKQGRPISIHHKDGSFKISPSERDSIYQEFIQQFPTLVERKKILREFRDSTVRRRAMNWFRNKAKQMRSRISATRIQDFVSEAVATEAGVRPKSERWDWWVGCSKQKS
ncbi:MAG TPA: hypothetical protein VG711_12260 [Phycisphaerales bacterium]|nr:hypothetical protein [Phycisphaerales bacterium]